MNQSSTLLHITLIDILSTAGFKVKVLFTLKQEEKRPFRYYKRSSPVFWRCTGQWGLSFEAWWRPDCTPSCSTRVLPRLICWSNANFSLPPTIPQPPFPRDREAAEGDALRGIWEPGLVDCRCCILWGLMQGGADYSGACHLALKWNAQQ